MTDQHWAPARIWLQREQGEHGSHTWCEDSVGDGDIIEEAEYVRVEAAPPPASTNRLTDEQIRAALAVQWPALYRDGIYTEHDGTKTRAQTAERVEIIRKQYAAIIAATEAK